MHDTTDRNGNLEQGARCTEQDPRTLHRRSVVKSLFVAGATGLSATAAGAQSASHRSHPKQQLPPIIDVHAHPAMPSFTAALRRNDKAGAPRLADLGINMPLADWTPAMGIEFMDANGIEAIVMSNPLGMAGEKGPAAATLARQVNDEMAAVIAAHPHRFGAFAMLPLADIDASLIELRRALDELRLDGVCLLTNVDGIYPGDSRFAPLFAELDRRKAVAFVHPISPTYLPILSLKFEPSLMEFMIDSTRAAASLIFSGLRRRYPNFTYISTHGGGTIPYLVHRFETGQLATKAYGVDMAPDEIRAAFQSLHFELTAATSAEQIAALLELVDTSQLMLGFDYPLRPTRLIPPACADLATSTYTSQADVRAIARTNALRILPGLAARLAVV